MIWMTLQKTLKVQMYFAIRPSLALTIGHRDAKKEHKELIDRWWAGDEEVSVQDVRWIVLKGNAETRMHQLKESFKQAAITALSPLEDASIKGLLRRVVTKIFNDVEIKGWCREFETKNAAGSETSTAASK